MKRKEVTETFMMILFKLKKTLFSMGNTINISALQGLKVAETPVHL